MKVLKHILFSVLMLTSVQFCNESLPIEKRYTFTKKKLIIIGSCIGTILLVLTIMAFIAGKKYVKSKSLITNEGNVIEIKKKYGKKKMFEVINCFNSKGEKMVVIGMREDFWKDFMNNNKDLENMFSSIMECQDKTFKIRNNATSGQLPYLVSSDKTEYNTLTSKSYDNACVSTSFLCKIATIVDVK